MEPVQTNTSALHEYCFHATVTLTCWLQSSLWDSCLFHNVIPQNIIILYNTIWEMFSPNSGNRHLLPCHGSYQEGNYFRFVCLKKKACSCRLFTLEGQLMWQMLTNIFTWFSRMNWLNLVVTSHHSYACEMLEDDFFKCIDSDTVLEWCLCAIRKVSAVI